MKEQGVDESDRGNSYLETSCFLCRGTGRDFGSPDDYCMQCNGWGFISDDELYEYLDPEDFYESDRHEWQHRET